MTQQIDPVQVKGLSSKSVDKLNNLANIQTIGNNLELTDDGTLNAVGGGGGGGGGGDVALYSALGQNTNGALTQKASTDLLVHAKPDGTNNLIEDNKITMSYLPDSILGQVLYGGGFVPTTGVATLTANAKERLDVSTPTITLTNNTAVPTGYEANEGIYYIATANGTFASISFQTGDWLISIGTSWSKVDNTDAVTGVKGANEQNYKLGNVNLSAQNVGAVSSTDAVSTQSITPFVTTSMINDSAVTSSKIASGSVNASKIDFTLTSGTITIPDGSSVASLTQWNYCRKFGNIVDIELRGRLSGSWTAGTSKTNQLLIPEGFRPTSEVTSIGYASPDAILDFWIGSSGQVEIRPNSTFSNERPFGGHFCYIIS